jgi:hypothetical protein
MSIASNCLPLQDSQLETEPEELLEYPRNFFRDKTGPIDIDDAALLWPYRKNRPKKGVVETEHPNGLVMLSEIDEIRVSLQAFVEAAYLDEVKEKAKEWNLLLPTSADKLVTKKDIKRSLSTLTDCSEDNKELVFKVCHHFHKKRTWLASVIDNWMMVNRMSLTPQKPRNNAERKRMIPTSRGGFSVVARRAKGQVVTSLMNPMLKRAGWSIALTNNGKKGKKTYTAVRTTGPGKPMLRYYVVTRTPGPPPIADDSDNDDDEEEEDSEDEDDIDSCIDYSNIASMMQSELGLTVSQQVIKKIIRKNVTPKGVECLTGKVMMIPHIQDNAETTITTENNNTSRSNFRTNTLTNLTDSYPVCDPSDPNDQVANALLYGKQEMTSANECFGSKPSDECHEEGEEDNTVDETFDNTHNASPTIVTMSTSAERIDEGDSTINDLVTDPICEILKPTEPAALVADPICKIAKPTEPAALVTDPICEIVKPTEPAALLTTKQTVRLY